MSDPYTKEAATLLEQAKGALASGADKLQSAAASPDLQKLLPYLLAGGAGAVGGGLLSGKRKKRSGETRGQYLTRILRNAAVTGGLVGGGSYLAHKGFGKTLGSLDTENPMTGKPGDQGPYASQTKDALTGAPLAALSSAGTLMATQGMKSIGAKPNEAQHIKGLQAHLKGPDGKVPADMLTKADWKARLTKDPTGAAAKLLGDPANKEEYKARKYHARAAGLNIHDPNKLTGIKGVGIRGVGHTAHELGKPFSEVLGRTGKRRALRGGVAGVGALLPSLAAALLTSNPEEA